MSLGMAEVALVPVERAVEAVSQVLSESGLSKSNTQIFKLIVASCKVVVVDGREYFNRDSLHGFVQNAVQAMRTGDSSYLTQRRGLRVDRVVDVIEFCESREFMGQAAHLRPVIRYELERLFSTDHYLEAVLTGGIGVGKTYFAEMAIGYMIYLLSCYHNPQLEHGLAPGSSIVFIQQSLTQTLAKKVIFEQFAERLKESPYFSRYFPYNPNIKSELRFPKNIYVMPVGGSDTAALGMNVFGGIIDELNFMARVEDSVMTRYTGEDEYDQAERAYRALFRRMKSRFMEKGKLPGKLMLVSSANYPGDFTSMKIEEAKEEIEKNGETSTFVMQYAQWEALPKERFSEGTFYVEVGNEYKRSRVLHHIDEARDLEDVIEVPIDYKADFERDVDGALRDFAGVSTGTRRPFIPYREEIVKAQEAFRRATGGKQLFLMDSLVLNKVIDQESPDWERIVDMDYIENCILDRSTTFASHIDVGLSHDAAGLALGRIVGYKVLPVTRLFNEKTEEFVEVKDIRAPLIQIDGMLQIKAEPGDEVDLELTRDLVLWICGLINLRWATMDSYQAPMFYQSFRKAKLRSGVLSVDTSIAPYTEYKLAIKDERIWIPDHDVLAKETREVERDPKKDKVDHRSGGSFVGSTRVRLPKGSASMQALAMDGNDVLIYTRNEDSTVTKSRGLKPRITGHKKEFIDVELANGAVERCTPDHLWLMACGSYKRADELLPGDDLFS